MIRQLAVLAVAAICLTGSTTAKSVERDVEVFDLPKLQELTFLLLKFRPNDPIDPEIELAAQKWTREYILESYASYYKIVKKFWKMYTAGMLPRDHVFSVFDPDHREQAITVFRVLYYAPSLAIFKSFACFCFRKLNQEMFIYTFSIAILHRQDTKDIELPLIYQIRPNKVYNTDFMTLYASRMIAFYKEHGVGLSLREPIWANYTYTYVPNIEDPETALTYFYEDVGINTCYYYMHLIMPFWMSSEEFPYLKERGLVSNFYFNWITKRIAMERQSHSLKPMEHLDWHEPIKVGYFPMMMHTNGILFPQRKAWAPIPSYYNQEVELVSNFERRLNEVADSGFILTENGTYLSIIENPDYVNILRNLIEGNADSMNFKYYGSMERLSREILGFSPKRKNEYHLMPSVMQYASSAMRDPILQLIYYKMDQISDKFTKHYQPRTVNEVINKHFSIKSFKVDPAITYFETYDTVVSNVTTTGSHEPFLIKARQTRLNHKKFEYHLDIKSDKIVEVAVRFFIGPSFSIFNKPTYHDLKKVFLVDYFYHKLVVGENKFSRSIKDSPIGVPDFRDYPWHDYKPVNFKRGFGWPQNLLIPKGTIEGMPVVYAVVVTELKPAEATEIKHHSYYWKDMDRDVLPLNYPFDLPLSTYNLTQYSNIGTYHSHITHKDESHINLTV